MNFVDVLTSYNQINLNNIQHKFIKFVLTYQKDNIDEYIQNMDCMHPRDIIDLDEIIRCFIVRYTEAINKYSKL